MTLTTAFHPFCGQESRDQIGALCTQAAELLLAQGLLRPCRQSGRLELCEPDVTTALEAMRDSLQRHGWIGPPRHERITVRLSPGGEPVGSVDRSAVRALGLWITKIHVNGVVALTDGGTGIWLSRRSPTAQWNPDRFDTMVAGGVALDQAPQDAMLTECWEEAGIGPDALSGLEPVRRIAVEYASDRGWHRELLIIHDLHLPNSFEPQCKDGEIAWSRRVDTRELRQLVGMAGEMKFSSAFVCRDLLERLSRNPSASWSETDGRVARAGR